MKTLLFLCSLLVALHIFTGCTDKAANSAVQILPSDTLVAKVVGIKDGDTYVLLAGQQQVTVRLSDIDCPEKKQPFGTKAKQFASDLCFGKTVTAIKKGRPDRYGRLIVEIYDGNTCINKELVKNGLAWHFRKYSRDESYAAIERTARNQKVGVWSEKNPIPPWDWRAPKK